MKILITFLLLIGMSDLTQAGPADKYKVLVKAVNKSFPMKISPDARIMKIVISNKGRAVTAIVQLNYTRSQLLANLKKSKRTPGVFLKAYIKQVRSDMCSYSIVQREMKNGVKFFTQMNYKDGSKLFKTNATINTCKKLKVKPTIEVNEKTSHKLIIVNLKKPKPVPVKKDTTCK